MLAKNLASAATVVLVVGTGCKNPDLTCTCFEAYAANARGANVIPAAADTAARASLNFNPASLAYSYAVAVTPTGAIDSIALYEVPAGQPLPASATVLLCAGAAACAATSGTGTLLPPATITTIGTSLRAYTTQVVFFTTTAQKAAGGAMRGTMYMTPQ